MDSERWGQIEALYHAALERSEGERRAAFLQEACGEDQELRREVESLLSSGAAAGTCMAAAAMEVAAEALVVTGREGVKSGSRISQYQIVEKLGAGGMGEVYRARDTKLGREVALKVLPGAVADDRERMVRFEREAKILASLNHPNIAAIYGLEDSGQVRALVMELVEGPTLEERISAAAVYDRRVSSSERCGERRRALPLDEALGIAKQVAEALEYAHEHGVIHRDLKPANLKIRPDGAVKVLDFGIAKALEEGAASAAIPGVPTAETGATRAGMILGTAAYMSPEQARGQAVDRRTDIWAFGCVLYEMLTGKHAFAGETSGDTLAAVITREPEWDALPATTPAEIQRLVRRCLMKDPKRRLQAIGEARIAIEETLSGADSVAPGFRPASRDAALKASATSNISDSQIIAALVKRHKKAIAGVIAAGVSITAVLIFALYCALSGAPAPANLEFTRVTGSGEVQQADISPDGNYVAYVRDTAGKQSIWLKQLATGSDVLITTLDDDVCPGLAFSPDGSYVYFVRKDRLQPAGDLYQVPFLGGTPRKILAGISGPPALSPNGQRVAYVHTTVGEYSLLIAALDGSGERVLTSYQEPGRILPLRVAWSPDGKTLSFCQRSPRPVLKVIPAEGGPAEPVAGTHWRDIEDLTWLPGSRSLLVAGSPQDASAALRIPQLYEVSVEGGQARQITHGLSEYTRVRVSADGKTLLALQDQTLATIQVAAPGKEAETKTLSAGDRNRDGQDGLAWTPDGEIVYFSFSSGRGDLWEVGADGSNSHRLTNGGGFSFSYMPAVSLQGNFIAFTEWDGIGQIRIWRMDMDGSNLKQLTQGKVDLYPVISPDGRWVVFTRIQAGKYILMKVSSEGGTATQLGNYNLGWPSVSPDGRWIACANAVGGNQPSRLAMIPFAGGQPAKVFSVPDGAHPPLRWPPDGHAISFINSMNGADNIWEQPIAGGPPKPVTHFTSGKIFSFAWSRDGRLALSRGTEPVDAVLIKNIQ
jgi:serine/threonine protein kinase/Tol biopolymer transport system component